MVDVNSPSEIELHRLTDGILSDQVTNSANFLLEAITNTTIDANSRSVTILVILPLNAI